MEKDKMTENEIDPQNFDQDELISIFDFQKMGKTSKNIKISASKEECEKLEKRFNIFKISSLDAFCTINHADDIENVFYKLDINIKANITQSCVVTLEPVEETLDHDSQTLLVHEKYFKELDEAEEIVFSEDDVDAEIINRAKGQSKVNLGEYVAQHLALALNPYPRKNDATGEELGTQILNEKNDPVGKDKKNPFDILKKLKK